MKRSLRLLTLVVPIVLSVLPAAAAETSEADSDVFAVEHDITAIIEAWNSDGLILVWVSHADVEVTAPDGTTATALWTGELSDGDRLAAESLMDGYFTCTRRVWRPRKDADSWIHSKIRQVCYGNLAESHWAGVRLQRDDPGGWWTRAEAESGWTPADAGWWIHQPVEQQCAFNTPKLDWRAQGYGEVRMSTGDFFELHDLNSPVRQNVCT